MSPLEAIDMPYDEEELKRWKKGLESIEDKYGDQLDNNEDNALSKAIEMIEEQQQKLKLLRKRGGKQND